jgi:peptidoglycan/xylan/chitin deacetylase (PgdA/CDA1 family)
MIRSVAASVLSKTGLGFVLTRTIPWSGVLVFNYHRLAGGDSPAFDRGVLSADAETFARQIRFWRSTLDIISPHDLPDVLARGRGRYGLITFDDGYRDNYEIAFPVLRAEGVPATFFVSTGFIDNRRLTWWDEIAWMVRSSQRTSIELPEWLPEVLPFDEPDRERAVSTLLRAFKVMPTESTDRFLAAIAEATESGRSGLEQGRDLWMSWDMLREMKMGGMTIAGHTLNHVVLARASRDRQREEITGCAARLAAEMGEPMRYFSYPVGQRTSFDAVTRECLREAGVRYAFSYYGGYRRFSDWDNYDIRRVPIEMYLTADWIRSIVALPQIFC